MARIERSADTIAQPKPLDWGPVDSPVQQTSLLADIQTFLIQTNISRRSVLKGALIGAAGIVSTEKAVEIAMGLLEKRERTDWEACNISNKVFCAQNKNALANVALATTFIPDGSLQDMNTSYGKWARQRDEKLIKVIVEEFGIRRVRVGGMGFNNLVDGNGNITLEFISWLPEYLAEHGVEMDIALGFKNIGYPEMFFPDMFLKKHHETPPQGGVITLDDELAKKSLDWSDQICVALGEYSKFITGAQPTNEPLAKFGPEQQTMGEDYVIELGKRMARHFPEADIIVSDNAWNFPARGKVPDILAELKASGIRNGVFGINLYRLIPQLYDMTFLPPALRRLDPVLIANLPGFSLVSDINRVLSMGLKQQFTEVQAEQYGDVTGWDDKEPGNSAIAYRHAIAGAISLTPGINDGILPEPVVFSTYSARCLAEAVIYKHLTSDRREMIEFTQMLAQQAA
jgi:hypothetical protein